MKRVAVVLSGCGYLDGAEIQESVLTLLALEQEGMRYQCFAPDREQAKVVDHLTGKVQGKEKRNVLHEAARIARGKIRPLSELAVEEFDAIMIPGGFGVATNLSNFAEDQENYDIDPKLKEVLQAFYERQKPIGATCIAPVVLAKAFENKIPLTLTLGSDEGSLVHLRHKGMNAVAAKVDEAVCDEENRVFTTPCYMEPPDLAGMYEGVREVARRLANWP